ncbi:CheB methylesterase domain-containing protein [Metallumcola ferriviriculae]|uniref:protein-glutamate methylesterase n=1 Tax=Metallumcola ferriviriculae TaxID=3039180 RepID=A0AAU0ULK8_9FIRM|nr:CheB methylesterase domain-containing protein [Desulfitibacteraceae bacterium MK1]
MNKLNVVILTANSLNKRHLVDAVKSTELAQVVCATSEETTMLEKISSSTIDVLIIIGVPPKKAVLSTVNVISQTHPNLHLILAVQHNEKDSIVRLHSLPELDVLDFLLLPHECGTKKHFEGIRNQLNGIFTQVITNKFTSITKKRLVPNTIGPEFEQMIPNGKVAAQTQLKPVELVVMAASTGGPAALESICRKLPPNFDIPILVIQHMPIKLTKNLARSLNKVSSLPVTELHEGDPIEPGQIMIAPGGLHSTIRISRGKRITKLLATPPVNGVRPAADVLFSSVAAAYAGKNILAIILTGMGTDGTNGVKALKSSCNCYCLAQNEGSCAVYGMPKSVVNAGLVDQVKDLKDLAMEIIKIVSSGDVKREC